MTIDDIDPETTWSLTEVAAYLGVMPGTYRAYVATQGAPAAISRDPGRGGQSRYQAAAIRHWHANRPGQGTRRPAEG